MSDELSQSPTWPYVLAFARRMEAKLAKNRHKGDREGWLLDFPDDLLDRVFQEGMELKQELSRWGLPPVSGEAGERVMDEAADVANMAMMTADCFDRRILARAESRRTPAPLPDNVREAVESVAAKLRESSFREYEDAPPIIYLDDAIKALAHLTPAPTTVQRKETDAD